MSAVLVLTPIIIANWPAIAAAVAGAASAMGLLVKESIKDAVKESQSDAEQSIEVEISDSKVLAESMTTDQEIALTKGSIELRVKRDERGRCVVCAKGIGHSEAELKQIAEQFTQKLTQCFVYDKVMRELKTKDFQVVNEEVMEDESIRIHVRRWMD
jgi:translation initiation factor 1 (eIF-1/SUI1)